MKLSKTQSSIALLLSWATSPCNAFAPTNSKEILIGRHHKGHGGDPSTGSEVLFGPLALAAGRGATTLEPPTKRRTSRDEDVADGNNVDDDDKTEYPDMEYLIDSETFRDFDDPFHILLMGSTFEKPKITVSYVAGSLEYVLSMPPDEGTELSKFAKDEGMACLGCWPRHECLTLGRQLQKRDIVCRVVPYAAGGQRGWQAKDASDASFNNDPAYYL
jgi:hypothetical protein